MDQSGKIEPELLHRFKNQLALGMGFCNLLIDEMENQDPRRQDILQVQHAIQEAINMLPELAEQMK
jgi:hypothetical protein